MSSEWILMSLAVIVLIGVCAGFLFAKVVAHRVTDDGENHKYDCLYISGDILIVNSGIPVVYPLGDTERAKLFCRRGRYGYYGWIIIYRQGKRFGRGFIFDGSVMTKHFQLRSSREQIIGAISIIETQLQRAGIPCETNISAAGNTQRKDRLQ